MFTTRTIEISDLELICDHRQRMFLESGKDQKAVLAMAGPFRGWLEDHLKRKTYFGFVVEHAGEVAASIGLMTIDWPPHPEHPQDCRRGYVLNLYVESAHRKIGLARNLMKRADEELLSRGVNFCILHPTAMARTFYESIGWAASGEMSRRLVSGISG